MSEKPENVEEMIGKVHSRMAYRDDKISIKNVEQENPLAQNTLTHERIHTENRKNHRLTTEEFYEKQLKDLGDTRNS